MSLKNFLTSKRPPSFDSFSNMLHVTNTSLVFQWNDIISMQNCMLCNAFDAYAKLKIVLTDKRTSIVVVQWRFLPMSVNLQYAKMKGTVEAFYIKKKENAKFLLLLV